jgi:uncharacterized Zn-finger protein
MIYACPQEGCIRKFTTKFSMQRHFRSHVGIKLHTCLFCPKQFTIKQYLIEHMLIHTQERPYKCPFQNCNKSFRQSGKLHMHKKLCHHQQPHIRAEDVPYPIMKSSELLSKYRTFTHAFSNSILPLPIPSDLMNFGEKKLKI